MRSRLRNFILLFWVAASEIFAAPAPSSAVLTAQSGGKAFTFVCEVERPGIKVFSGDKVGAIEDALIDQRLDDTDDCNGAEWSVNQLSGSDVTLVMINPGRLGVNAQMNVYALQRGVATFAGYLPVGADYGGKGEYSFEFEQADGFWRDIYEVSDGKISLSREIRLVRSGDVCVDKSQEVTDGATCNGRRLKASGSKPLCIVYRNKVGRISPISACSKLMGRP